MACDLEETAGPTRVRNFVYDLRRLRRVLVVKIRGNVNRRDDEVGSVSHLCD